MMVFKKNISCHRLLSWFTKCKPKFARPTTPCKVLQGVTPLALLRQAVVLLLLMLLASNVAAQLTFSEKQGAPEGDDGQSLTGFITTGGTLPGGTRVILTYTYTDGTAVGGPGCTEGIDYLKTTKTDTVRTGVLHMNALNSCGNNKDEINTTYTITITAPRDVFDDSQPHCKTKRLCTVEYTIVDDDVTKVDIDGLDGIWQFIQESKTKTIAMELSRALIMKEHIDVPIRYQGITFLHGSTPASADDYQLRLKPGAANVGVTVGPGDTVTFEAGAEVATLEFEAIHDTDTEEDNEAVQLTVQNPTNVMLQDNAPNSARLSGSDRKVFIIQNNSTSPTIAIRTKVLLEGPLQ